MQGNTHRISLSELSEFRMGVFAKLEFLTEYAEAVTSGLLEAHLRGAHKQGAGRLPIYVKRIKLGFINNKPDAKAVTETSGSAILHGDHGMGHYAGSKGIDLATSSIPNLLCRFRAEGPNHGRYFRETSLM